MGRAPPTPKECGLGPIIAIGAYATGAGSGTTYCKQDCRSFLPLPPRNDELQNGPSRWAMPF